MGCSASKIASRPGRLVQGRSSGEDDPHDAIDFELLQLWIGISRLREKLHTNQRPKLRKPSKPRISRRKAA